MTVEEEPLLDEEYHHGSDTAVDLWYMLAVVFLSIGHTPLQLKTNRDNIVRDCRMIKYAADLAGLSDIAERHPRGRAATIARGMKVVCLILIDAWRISRVEKRFVPHLPFIPHFCTCRFDTTITLDGIVQRASISDSRTDCTKLWNEIVCFSCYVCACQIYLNGIIYLTV